MTVPAVIPAQAGNQEIPAGICPIDSRLRGNDKGESGNDKGEAGMANEAGYDERRAVFETEC